MELVERIKKEFAAFDEKRKALARELQEQFPQLLKPLFDKHAWVETVSWRQYEPWNDGDETEFEVMCDHDNITINDLNWYDDEVYNDEAKKDVFKEFSEVLKEIPEDLMKSLFGESNEVEVKRTGEISVTDYSD
jgi:hypothetical protein